jgi:TolA-binding protein
MSKGILRSVKTYAKNIGKHVESIATRKESPVKAASALVRDTKKLKRAAMGKKERSGDRRSATRLVKDGRRSYNAGDYAKAEEKFRSAIVADKSYALAYTYMGHSLYKQGKTGDAASYWRMAIQTDPASEAASKAMNKLKVLDKQKEEVRAWVKDRSGQF